jgi:hypothetical protein
MSSQVLSTTNSDPDVFALAMIDGQAVRLPPHTYEIDGRVPRGGPDRHIEHHGPLLFAALPPRDFNHPYELAPRLEQVRHFLQLQPRCEEHRRRRLMPYWVSPEWAHLADDRRQRLREHLTAAPAAVFQKLFSIAFWIYDGRHSSFPIRLAHVYQIRS